MSISHSRGAVEWALMVGLVFGAGALAQAQEEEQADGRVVQIGRADGEEASKPAFPAPDDRGAKAEQQNLPGFPNQQQELPKYWIGLLGGSIEADHPLRAHIDLPQDQGLLVANVVPDSPAAKAGLKRHDILLRANDQELREMTDLVGLVRTEGEKKGQITVDVLRHGERESIYLTPEERPADANVPQTGGGEGGFGRGIQLPEGFPKDLLNELEGRGLPFDFRNFGPGVIVGGRGLGGVPNGVSVSIQKEDGQPTRVTVKRGEETWEVAGDDPESLEQLPEDLRPFVEQMLHGGSPLGMEFQMPNLQGLEGRRGFSDERLRERLEQMEQRMEALQKRLMDTNDRAANETEEAQEADQAK